MTAVQFAEFQTRCVSLYKKGRRITEIAVITGRSKGTISRIIKEATAQRTPAKRPEPVVCKYSADCFSCPMGDCVINGTQVNALPYDHIYMSDDYI